MNRNARDRVRLSWISTRRSSTTWTSIFRRGSERPVSRAPRGPADHRHLRLPRRDRRRAPPARQSAQDTGQRPQPPVISPLVIAEIDYMVLDKAGVARELDVIDDLTSGAYEIPDLGIDDLRTARRVAARHP